MTERRRLPVLNSRPPAPEQAGQAGGSGSDDDADETRPPWHWIGFGTIAIFAAWLPLAYAAQAVVARVLAQMFGAGATAEEIGAKLASSSSTERLRLTAILALPNALAFALAAFAGGYLVGRFAPRAGAREAALSGFVTALFAVVIAWGGLSLGYLLTAIVILVVAVLFAAWGGRFGASKRGPSAVAE